jgi:hypothetical protein
MRKWYNNYTFYISGKIIAASFKTITMQLPIDFQRELLPYIDESEPTPKETLVCRIIEHAWEKKNFRAILNYLFAIPAELFFKDGDEVRFA